MRAQTQPDYLKLSKASFDCHACAALPVPRCSAAVLARCHAPCTGCRHVLCPKHARAAAQVLDMIEHGFAKRGINLTTLPARLLYRSAYVVLISFVACTIPFFGVRAAAARLAAACGARHSSQLPALNAWWQPPACSPS